MQGQIISWVLIVSHVALVRGLGIEAVSKLLGSGSSAGALGGLGSSLGGSGNALGGGNPLDAITKLLTGNQGLTDANDITKQLQSLFNFNGIVEETINDLKKDFKLADSFPLGNVLGSDPIGKLPVDAISRGNIDSAQDLFKAPAADPLPKDEPDAGLTRQKECSEKLDVAAKAFGDAYSRQRGRPLINFYANQQKTAVRNACKPTSAAVATNKQRAALAQFNAAANSAPHQLTAAAKKAGIPLSTDRNEKLSSFLNGVLSKKTEGAVDDAGSYLVESGRATCKKLVDAEVSSSACTDAAEAMCTAADSVAEAASSGLSSAAEVRSAAAKIKPVRASSSTRLPAASSSCRCIGDTLRAGTQQAGAQRLADKCLTGTQAALLLVRDTSTPATLAERFLVAQSAGAEVSFEPILTPDQLKVTNLAGSVFKER